MLFPESLSACVLVATAVVVVLLDLQAQQQDLGIRSCTNRAQAPRIARPCS